MSEPLSGQALRINYHRCGGWFTHAGGQQLAAAICESARSVAPSRLARLGKAVSLDEGRRGVSGQRLLGEVGLPSSFSCSSGAALSDVVISDPLGDPTLGDPYLCSLSLHTSPL